MSVTLRATVGTVNFTDWLHITATKVPTGSPVVWETWIDVPFTSYNLIIPGLDPENYIIRFYDAPTDTALGTLHLQLLVSALTNEWEYERIFYTVDGPGVHDPVDGDTGVTDPYLIDKNVTGVFKEAFRYLKPTDEYTNNQTTGNVDIINGTQLSSGEVLTVEIKYAVGVVAPGGGAGLYSGILNVPLATYTMLSSDRNKLVRLVGSAPTQVVTLCPLGELSVDDGYYFDNSCGGVAVQVKLLVNGEDRILFNGFSAASNEFPEFWVSRGEHLLLKKIDSAYWEVRTDYKGVEVGSRQSACYHGQAGWLPEDGAIMDGDEYPRLWWYINTILPGALVVTDDGVGGIYMWPAGKTGLFVKHSTLKTFRMPNTQGLSEKGSLVFATHTDPDRTYDWPGGTQAAQVGEFTSNITIPKGNSYTGGPNTLRCGNGANSPQDFQLPITANAGKTNTVPNFAVIFMRKI